MITPHVGYVIFHGAFGLAVIFTVSNLSIELMAARKAIYDNALLFALIALTVSFFCHYFFYRNTASKVIIDESTVRLRYNLNKKTVPISSIKVLHLMKPFWYQLLLKKDDHILFLTYKNEEQLIPRSLSLGIRSDQEIKSITAKLPANIKIRRSTHFLY